MFYVDKPNKFNPKFDVVGCIVESDGKILLLQRLASKHHGKTWGLPGGKIDQNETKLDSLSREIFEETGFSVLSNSLVFISTVYVILPELSFNYHIYWDNGKFGMFF